MRRTFCPPRSILKFSQLWAFQYTLHQLETGTSTSKLEGMCTDSGPTSATLRLNINRFVRAYGQCLGILGSGISKRKHPWQEMGSVTVVPLLLVADSCCRHCFPSKTNSAGCGWSLPRLELSAFTNSHDCKTHKYAVKELHSTKNRLCACTLNRSLFKP